VVDTHSLQFWPTIQHPQAFNYVRQTWLPLKENFVVRYVKRIRHLGSSTTSHVEGNHHVLKSYIKLGRFHLLDVVKRMTLLWKNQLGAIHKEVERQKLAGTVFQS
jgi:hypothetical protein